MARFVVVLVQGPAWRAGTGMREQAGWDAHAAFMDALVDEGFVTEGGPLDRGDGVHRALLLVESAGEDAVLARLAADPWAADGLLEVESVGSWTVLLGRSG